jgi:hypothetical protein
MCDGSVRVSLLLCAAALALVVVLALVLIRWKMKLRATVRSVTQSGTELALVIRGWADSDPNGTKARDLGTINIPADDRVRKAYHVGRRIVIEVKTI